MAGPATFTVCNMKVSYRLGNATFIRRFRIETTVFAFSDYSLVGGDGNESLPKQFHSPDNLRAALRFAAFNTD